MLIVEPDFSRRIDLPGNGPCPRPVDIDQGTTGFAKLVSLRIYSFAAGAVVDGEAEGDEVFIVLMRGAVAIGVTQQGKQVGPFSLDTEGGSRAVYLPPHAGYQLTARTACDVAYARVRPPGSALKAARDFAPAGGRLYIADYAGGMDLVLTAVTSGNSLALSGRDDALLERFVHIRSDGGVAAVGGARLLDWQSAALEEGEAATLEATGSAELLMITASAR